MTDMKTEENYLGMIQICVLELKKYQNEFNKEEINKDMEGYIEILNSKSEVNAFNFLKIKSEATKSGKPFKDNFEALAALKATGLWVN